MTGNQIGGHPRVVVAAVVGALALLGGGLTLGCGRSPATGFRLVEQLAAEDRGAAAGVTLPASARRDRLAYEHQERVVVMTPLAGWTWKGRVPEGARLGLGCQLAAGSWRQAHELTVTVEVRRRGGAREIVEVGRLRGRNAPRRWLDFQTDLSPYAGERVEVTVSASAPGLEDHGEPLVAWGPASLGTAAERRARPSILFILVDTLRADRLQAYGWQRPTSPEIQALLAERGVVLENAYSQAPWTLPSVVSLMTGLHPGEVFGDDIATYGLPPDIEVLGERLAAAGYETAAFYGNPTLHAGNGFARGMGTYFNPDQGLDSMRLHAGEITRRALPWLLAHSGRPFFAYLHYIDPHDPYEAPGTEDGTTPFYPGTYRGALSGRHVHGVYTGHHPITGPEDVAYLSAMYESEIRHVDEHIGRVLRALPPAVLADTLVVLTSDHGEELYDHGGWKHGHTLYEDQIHVPLMMRWDGHLAPGRRVAGTVRLLDLHPTLVELAGGEVPAALPGIDLMPVLRGERALPRLPAFAQHLSSGPLRAAVVLDGRKLMMFDREAPFAPGDRLQAHLWQVDVGRLARAELYDLAADPGERRNLYPSAGVEALRGVLSTRLDRALPAGLRLAVSGLPAGSRLIAKIEVDRAVEPAPAPVQEGGAAVAGAAAPAHAAAPRPLFFAPDDAFGWDGATLELAVGAEPLDKLVIVPGEVRQVRLRELRLEDGAAATLRIAAGSGAPAPRGSGTVFGVTELRAEGVPAAADGATVRLWWGRGPSATVLPPSSETMRRLRALGYVQ